MLPKKVRYFWRFLGLALRQFCQSVVAVWRKFGTRILIAYGLCLLAGGAFMAGVASSAVWYRAPMVIVDGCVSPTEASQATQDGTQHAVPQKPEDCVYVGSKNSTKYYPPTCSAAKRIAPENIRCFTSDADAQKKGYVRSASC